MEDIEEEKNDVSSVYGQFRYKNEKKKERIILQNQNETSNKKEIKQTSPFLSAQEKVDSVRR